MKSEKAKITWVSSRKSIEFVDGVGVWEDTLNEKTKGIVDIKFFSYNFLHEAIEKLKELLK